MIQKSAQVNNNIYCSQTATFFLNGYHVIQQHILCFLWAGETVFTNQYCNNKLIK